MRLQRRILVGGLFAAILAVGALSVARAEEKTGTVQGYVLDSACAFVRNVKKPMNAGRCALECAKAGSPLVILTEDGTLYWPISDAMPATGQNPRLMEYAGKKVTVQGNVFERGGSHAIVINKIEVQAESK
jgi:hypothetical protein